RTNRNVCSTQYIKKMLKLRLTFRSCMPAAVLLLSPVYLKPAFTAADHNTLTPRLNPDGIDGSLVISGAGNTPEAAFQRFFELAGGKNAHLGIIPTARYDADQADPNEVLADWKSRGPASAVVLHTRSRQTADQADFFTPLRTATAVWFSGGSQDRIAAA